MTIKESRSSLVKKKKRRNSIRMLCNGGMVLAIATGIWFRQCGAGAGEHSGSIGR